MDDPVPCLTKEPHPDYRAGTKVAPCGEPFAALVRDDRRNFHNMCAACAVRVVNERGWYVYRTKAQLEG